MLLSASCHVVYKTSHWNTFKKKHIETHELPKNGQNVPKKVYVLTNNCQLTIAVF